MNRKRRRSMILSAVFALLLAVSLIPAPQAVFGETEETTPEDLNLVFFSNEGQEGHLSVDPAAEDLQTMEVPKWANYTYISAKTPDDVTMSVTRDGLPLASPPNYDPSTGYWYCDSSYISSQPSTYVITFSKDGAQPKVYTITVTGGTPLPTDDASVRGIYFHGITSSYGENSSFSRDLSPIETSHTIRFIDTLVEAQLYVSLDTGITIKSATLNGESISITSEYPHYWESEKATTLPSTYVITTLARDGRTEKTYTITLAHQAQIAVRLWDRNTMDDIGPGISYVTYDYNVGDRVPLSEIAKTIPGYTLLPGQEESYLIEQEDWKITLLYTKTFKVKEASLALEAIKGRLPDGFLKKYPKFILRDISLTDLEGNPLPSSVPFPVEITVKLPGLDLDHLEIFHLSDEDGVEKIEKFSVNKGTGEVTFFATDFSPFIFANRSADQTTGMTDQEAGTVAKVAATPKTPKTGDESHGLMATLLMMAGAAGCATLIRRRKCSH